MNKDVVMLCEPSLPFDSDEYLFEIKFDGERSLLLFDKGKVFIQNRRGEDITYKYPELHSLADHRQGLVDGEIVVFDQEGKTNFELLSQRSHLQKKFDIELRMKQIRVVFMAFDVLSINNEDITNLPLSKRREILYQEFPTSVGVFHWSLSMDKEGKGKALFEQARQLDLEGIVGKHIDSPYLPGRRSPYWKKMKNQKSVDLEFSKYTINNAGVRVENEEGIAVQVAGINSRIVKKAIDERGSVLIEVKYLNRTSNNRLRQPTFKAIKQSGG